MDLQCWPFHKNGSNNTDFHHLNFPMFVIFFFNRITMTYSHKAVPDCVLVTVFQNLSLHQWTFPTTDVPVSLPPHTGLPTPAGVFLALPPLFLRGSVVCNTVSWRLLVLDPFLHWVLTYNHHCHSGPFYALTATQSLQQAAKRGPVLLTLLYFSLGAVILSDPLPYPARLSPCPTTYKLIPWHHLSWRLHYLMF